MVLRTATMGRNCPQSVPGVPAPPAQKPNLKQRKGNDTSYLTAIAWMWLENSPSLSTKVAL